MTFSLGRIQTDLIKQLLHKLNESLKDTEVSKDIDSEKVLRIIGVLEQLLPFILFFCVSNEQILGRVEKDMAIELSKLIIFMVSLV